MRDPKTFSPWLGAWIAISIFAFVMLGCPTDSITGELNGGGGNDTAAPVPGDNGAIVCSNPTATSVDLSWTAASDNTTATEDLEYQVFYSTSDNITGVTAAGDNGTPSTIGWTANIVTHTVSSLSAETTYYFVVVVQDEAGRAAAYTPTSVATILPDDDTAPTVTGSIVTMPTWESIEVSWPAATDDRDAAEDLVYALYHSTVNTLSTVAQTESTGTLVDSGTNLLSKTITGLTFETGYYVNVIVWDAAGNKAQYGSTPQTTDTGPRIVKSGGSIGDSPTTSISHSGSPHTHDETYQILNSTGAAADHPLEVTAWSITATETPQSAVFSILTAPPTVALDPGDTYDFIVRCTTIGAPSSTIDTEEYFRVDITSNDPVNPTYSFTDYIAVYS